MAGPPIKASLTPSAVQSAPPLLGQDTDAVLRQLGYSPEEIGAFRAEGDTENPIYPPQRSRESAFPPGPARRGSFGRWQNICRTFHGFPDPG